MKKIKFNLIDILVVVLVLALIAGGVFFAKSYNKNEEQGTKTIVLEAKELKKSICDVVKTDDIAYDGTKNTRLGEIVDFEVKPAMTDSISSRDGVVKKVEIPERYDLYLTIEVPQNSDIQIGEHFWIETSVFKCNGYVLEIN